MVYRQYCVLVDDKYAKYTDTDWLSVETIQKHVNLARIISKHVKLNNSKRLERV